MPRRRRSDSLPRAVADVPPDDGWAGPSTAPSAACPRCAGLLSPERYEEGGCAAWGVRCLLCGWRGP